MPSLGFQTCFSVLYCLVSSHHGLQHTNISTPAEELHGQGEGLAQAMRQVPMQYFTEEFDLTRCRLGRDTASCCAHQHMQSCITIL